VSFLVIDLVSDIDAEIVSESMYIYRTVVFLWN